MRTWCVWRTAIVEVVRRKSSKRDLRVVSPLFNLLSFAVKLTVGRKIEKVGESGS